MFRGKVSLPGLLYGVQVQVWSPTETLDEGFEEAFLQVHDAAPHFAHQVFVGAQQYFLENEEYFGPEDDYDDTFAHWLEEGRYLQVMGDVTLDFEQGSDGCICLVWRWWDWPWDGEHGVFRDAVLLHAGDGETPLP